MSKDCIFCKIIKGEIPSAKIYEDDKILAFLDINPIKPGHTLVIPKVHRSDLLAAENQDLVELIKIIKRIAPAAVAGVGADGFNVGLNDGSAAGQIVFHLHFHIIPRFNDDNLKLWSGRPYEAGAAEIVAEKIKKQL